MQKKPETPTFTTEKPENQVTNSLGLQLLDDTALPLCWLKQTFSTQQQIWSKDYNFLI